MNSRVRSIKTLLYCALTLLVIQSVHAATYRLHTVQPGGTQGHVRITNLLDVDGLVEIRGFDDQGEAYTGGWLDMEERASVTLSGEELEQAHRTKGCTVVLAMARAAGNSNSRPTLS